MSDVAGEEWARRVRVLGEDERARRLRAVEVLLGEVDEISDPVRLRRGRRSDRLAHHARAADVVGK